MEFEQKNHTLTQRIVGAIVLISLGIIFIPLFLETDRINPGAIEESPIPEIPGEISTIVFQLNEETGKFEEKGNSKTKEYTEQIIKEFDEAVGRVEVVEEPTPDVEPKVTTTQEAAPPTHKSTPPSSSEKITHTWVLQMASFKDKNNAIKLRDRIRKRGFVSHIDEQKNSSGSVWRVRVGPELRKSRIVEIQKILENEFSLKGLIVRRR